MQKILDCSVLENIFIKKWCEWIIVWIAHSPSCSCLGFIRWDNLVSRCRARSGFSLTALPLGRTCGSGQPGASSLPRSPLPHLTRTFQEWSARSAASTCRPPRMNPNQSIQWYGSYWTFIRRTRSCIQLFEKVYRHIQGSLSQTRM